MPAAIKWEDGFSLTTLLSTDLNSLADNTMSAASTEYDNGTNLNTLAWFELVLGSLTPVAPGPHVALYMTKELDGITYESAPVTGGANQGHLRIGTFPITTATAAKRVSIGPILLPPCAVTFYLDNQMNVAMASSGNTLKMGIENYESQ